MFERFTDRARRVVVLAQEEARRLQHNFIGTEHILLALIREGNGVAAKALERYEGLTLDDLRDEVKAMVGTGTTPLKGHIPFTPRAKKVLELALREALQLNHNYIGTEHILLGLIREGDGVGAQILAKRGADLATVRDAVIELLHGYTLRRGGRWTSRRVRETVGIEALAEPAGVSVEQRVTPAADRSFGEAVRLAAGQAVGSHHLMLAALSDANTAASKVLAALGVDLDRARDALRGADVTGTADELPEEAGRRQMLILVTGDKVTIEATDPEIIKLGLETVQALGDPPGSLLGTIRGDLPESASLSAVWLALHDGLNDIRRRVTLRTAEAASAQAAADTAAAASTAGGGEGTAGGGEGTAGGGEGTAGGGNGTAGGGSEPGEPGKDVA